MESKIGALVEKLRDAGEALRSLGDQELVLPMPEQPPAQLLDALRLGGTAKCRDIGDLVYYLADMLEE